MPVSLRRSTHGCETTGVKVRVESSRSTSGYVLGVSSVKAWLSLQCKRLYNLNQVHESKIKSFEL
jgi:hypothetical protein